MQQCSGSRDPGVRLRVVWRRVVDACVEGTKYAAMRRVDAVAELTVMKHADVRAFLIVRRSPGRRTARAQARGSEGASSPSVVATVAPCVCRASGELPLPVRAVLAVDPAPRRGVEVEIAVAVAVTSL